MSDPEQQPEEHQPTSPGLKRSEPTDSGLFYTEGKTPSAETQQLIADAQADVHRVVHDVKNMLAIINATIEVAEKKAPSEETRQEIEKMRGTILQMVRRIQRTLSQPIPTFEKIKHGETLKLEHFLLEESILEVTEMFPDTTFSIESEPNPVEIEADREFIFSILYNIIQNAVKFSRSNDSTSEPIRIQLSQQGFKAIIKIQDSGPGLVNNPADLFKKFYRGSNTSHMEGTGTGLATCFRYCNYHRGHIKAENNTPEPGATFIITIPTIQTIQ